MSFLARRLATPSRTLLPTRKVGAPGSSSRVGSNRHAHSGPATPPRPVSSRSGGLQLRVVANKVIFTPSLHTWTPVSPSTLGSAPRACYDLCMSLASDASARDAPQQAESDGRGDQAHEQLEDMEFLLDPEQETKVEAALRQLKEKEKGREKKEADLADPATPAPEAMPAPASATTATPAPAAPAPLYQRMTTRQWWTDLWQAIKHEAAHYKAGFQLLWTDIGISSRLLRKTLQGQKLTRRERNQFVRTLGDLFRVVPFSVFIIVPGAELLLPFAIKLFPGMLPSQFQHEATQNNQRQATLKVKLEMAKFLQETVEEMAVKSSTSETEGSVAKFSEFLTEGRKVAGEVSTEEILAYSRLFKDELTLDNLSREQLVACCRLLGITPIGTSQFLRFQLRTTLKQLRMDDVYILQEGVESMNSKELQQAARERGMRAIGITEDKLRQRIKQWVDLHLKHGVPSSLLLLSRVMYLPENIPEPARIKKVLESLSESTKEQAKVELVESEGGTVHAATILKVRQAEEEAIRLEKQEEEARVAKAKAKEEAEARAKEEAEAEAEAEARAQRSRDEEAKDGATDDTLATARAAHQEELKEVAAEKARVDAAAKEEELVDTAPVVAEATATKGSKEDDVVLTQDETIDLYLAIIGMGGEKPLDSLLVELKDDIEDYQLASKELFEAGANLEESTASRTLHTRVKRMLANIEDDTVDGNVPFKVLDYDDDGIISEYELMSAMKRMRRPPSPERMKRIVNVLDADCDGRINLDVIRRVLGLVESEGEDVDSVGLGTLVRLVEKEKIVTERSDKELAAETDH